MSGIQLGDTIKLTSKLLFGDEKWREGTITAVGHDGRLTADFPQPPYPPMKVTAQPDEFVLVTSAQSLRDEIEALNTQLDLVEADRQRLIAARKYDTNLIRALRHALTEIRHLHTDSPAGVCPSCADFNASIGDDPLIPWPCPTVKVVLAVDEVTQ